MAQMDRPHGIHGRLWPPKYQDSIIHSILLRSFIFQNVKLDEIFGSFPHNGTLHHP
jgi:hypothetical protein